jgi:hypothetical protein
MTARVEVPMGLAKAERETVCQWDDESRTVVIWSASPTVIRRLHRLGLTPSSESRRTDGRLHGYEFRLPVASFRWGLRRQRKAQNQGFLRGRPAVDASSSSERVSGRGQSADTPDAAV